MKPFRVLAPNLPDPGGHGLCALAVMTKAPQAGRVKTRLVPPLTPEEAAELNKCFLRDTAVAISSACSRRPMGGANKMDRQERASHPPSRSFGVAGSEAATAVMGEAVVLAEAAVLG